MSRRPSDQLAELILAFIHGSLKGLGIVAIIAIIAIIAVLIFCFEW